MDWMAPIDLYCERMAHGLWAEPINAISNIAFLVAAGVCFAFLKRRGRSDPPVLALIAIVTAIGLGSFLFHIFANGWSLIADIAPITLFIYFYLGLALRRFFAFRWPATIGVLALFLALSWPIEALLSPLLVGSAGYVPPLAAMAVIGVALAVRRHAAAPFVLAAAGIFLISLTLRTLDAPLCGLISIGTHWLWHLLNAATLATLILAALTPSNQRTSADQFARPTA
jgi:hypothetical protein